jgi:hypothetical protein
MNMRCLVSAGKHVSSIQAIAGQAPITAVEGLLEAVFSAGSALHPIPKLEDQVSVYLRAIGSIFVAFYDWQGYGGYNLTHLHTGQEIWIQRLKHHLMTISANTEDYRSTWHKVVLKAIIFSWTFLYWKVFIQMYLKTYFNSLCSVMWTCWSIWTEIKFR